MAVAAAYKAVTTELQWKNRKLRKKQHRIVFGAQESRGEEERSLKLLGAMA